MRIKPYLDDYAGLEADVLLTAILFERINPPMVKLNILNERIKFLEKLLLGK
jgi:hypothetical protein